MKLDSPQDLNTIFKISQASASDDPDFRQALTYIGVGVIIVNCDGKVCYFNPLAEELTGLQSKDVIGWQFNQVMRRVAVEPESLNFFALKSIAARTEYDAKIYPRSGMHRDLKIHVAVNPDVGNGMSGYVFTLQDVTQMRREAQRTQRQYSLRILSDMAARLAHEIRNPLGSIELFASGINTAPDIHPETKELAAYISASVESINAIIENLIIAVNPRQAPDFSDIDLRKTLEDSLFFANHLFNSNTSIRVNTRLNRLPLKVRGDRQLLKQVMLNLILNAIQAMPHGGALTITSQSVRQGSSGSRVAEIRIADTGVGIAAKDLERVFDPYYTTKEDGSGLGMSIVDNILTAHKGTIEIKSAPLQGTECIVQLPLINDAATNTTVKAGLQNPVILFQSEPRNQNVRAIHSGN